VRFRVRAAGFFLTRVPATVPPRPRSVRRWLVVSSSPCPPPGPPEGTTYVSYNLTPPCARPPPLPSTPAPGAPLPTPHSAHLATGGRKNRFKIRDLFADERCGQTVLDFLSTTNVGRRVGVWRGVAEATLPPTGLSSGAFQWGAALEEVLPGLGPVRTLPERGCGPILRLLQVSASETMACLQLVESRRQPFVALCWH